MNSRLLGGTFRQNGNHNDVAEPLAQRQAGIARRIRRLFLLVFRVLTSGQVAGLWIKRFQHSMERPGSHQMKIRLVDVILLDFLEHFAVDRERLVRFVVRRTAEDMTQPGVTEDNHR